MQRGRLYVVMRGRLLDLDSGVAIDSFKGSPCGSISRDLPSIAPRGLGCPMSGGLVMSFSKLV